MIRAKRLLYSKATLKTEILSTPVKDLGLRIERNLLDTSVQKALHDARAFGVELEPRFYLSDCYGCMQGTMSIGLGFWDADKLLREILKETKDSFNDEGDLLLLIKHEIGHAFCYAYKLYRLKEFREIFNVEGHFFNTYPENERYRHNPWSMDYVNPDGDHYAQKHPDDDFAETFATYIDSNGTWKERYKRRTAVFRKIQFIRRVVRTYGRKRPLISDNGRQLDSPVGEMKGTVAEVLSVSPRRYLASADGYIDPELRSIFRAPGRIQRPTLPSWQLVQRYRLFIEKTVSSVSRNRDARVARELISKAIGRLKALKLVYLEENQEKTLAAFTSLMMQKALLFKLYGTFRLPPR